MKIEKNCWIFASKCFKFNVCPKVDFLSKKTPQSFGSYSFVSISGLLFVLTLNFLQVKVISIVFMVVLLKDISKILKYVILKAELFLYLKNTRIRIIDIKFHI